MRAAVLSDVHSNLEALDAVLAAADGHGCERLLVLGDLVGYGADPDAVIARLVERNAVAIAGNHDLAAIGRFDATWFNEVAAAAIAWTSETMSADARAFLEGLDPRRDEPDAVLVHGSVRDPAAEYLLTVPDAEASFGLAAFDVAFFGHTHLPTVFRRDANGRVSGWVMPDEVPVELEPGSRFMLNPGSVGQPRDRDPRAAFLVWEDGRVVGHRVAYDTERPAAKIVASGLPRWLGDRLSLGE
ncbi:MAG: metallophosphoesterase family protein [Actinomycetota bacterium]